MAAQEAELIRRSYDALNRGDFDAWLELSHPDAQLHDLAEVPGTGIYRGHDGLRLWVHNARDLVGDWHWTVEEFVRDRNPFVTRVRVTAHGRESDVPVDQVIFHVFEMRDGRAAVLRGFLEERDALASAEEAAQ